jgi:hypothetical protein
VLGVVRHVPECSVRYFNHHLWSARADDTRRAEQIVRVWGVALVERTRDFLLGRVWVKYSKAPDVRVSG